MASSVVTVVALVTSVDAVLRCASLGSVGFLIMTSSFLLGLVNRTVVDAVCADFAASDEVLIEICDIRLVGGSAV